MVAEGGSDEPTPDEANSLLSLSSITMIEQYKVPSENSVAW